MKCNQFVEFSPSFDFNRVSWFSLYSEECFTRRIILSTSLWRRYWRDGRPPAVLHRGGIHFSFHPINI
jgi:hypothetical protein